MGECLAGLDSVWFEKGRSVKQVTRLLLLVILVTAFFLRLAGIDFGLPHLYHQDEPIVVNHALAYGTGDLHPHFFKLPPLLSYVLCVIYVVYYLILHCVSGVSTDSFAMLFFKDPSIFYILGRLFFGVLLGTASVAVVYRIGRELFNEATALLAAALLASCFLHVRDSHYIYADIPMMFSILMTFSALTDFTKQRKDRAYWGACVWAGIAVAFKYIAAPIALPLAVVMFNRPQSGTNAARRVLAGLFVMAATYAVLNPFSFFDPSFFVQEIRQQAHSESAMPFFYHLTYSLFEGGGRLVVCVGIAGLAWGWFKTPSLRWLFIFPIVFYLMISVFSQEYERYAMPVFPFLCLSAAWMVDRLAKVVRHPAHRFIVLGMAAAILVFPTLQKSLQVDRLFLSADTRTVAARWIESHLPANTVILLDHSFFSPRLCQTKRQLEDKIAAVSQNDLQRQTKIRKVRMMAQASEGKKAFRIFYLNEEGLDRPSFTMWSPLLAPNVEAIRSAGVEYFVRYRYPGETDFFERFMRDQVELVKTFSPYKSPQKIFTEDNRAHVALPFLSRELFSRLSSGPYLEIYRMKSH